MRYVHVIITLICAVGCSQPTRLQPGPSADGSAGQRGPAGEDVRQVIQPADPEILLRPQVHLSLYQLQVPAGTVSGNEAFWKRVDEQALDVTAYDVLYKNGMRAGRVPLADLEQVLREIAGGPVEPRPVTFITAGSRTVELPVKQRIEQQIIYSFDSRNQLSMKTYEECDNLFLLEFRAVPRKPGDVWISLCPLVRSLRRQPVADRLTGEIEFIYPQRLFEVNLRTEIPLDGCLVIAPSPEARAAMSLGHAFLVHEGATGEEEMVMLIVPQAIKPTPRKAPETVTNSPPGSADGEHSYKPVY